MEKSFKRWIEAPLAYSHIRIKSMGTLQMLLCLSKTNSLTSEYLSPPCSLLFHSHLLWLFQTKLGPGFQSKQVLQVPQVEVLNPLPEQSGVGSHPLLTIVRSQYFQLKFRLSLKQNMKTFTRMFGRDSGFWIVFLNYENV